MEKFNISEIISETKFEIVIFLVGILLILLSLLQSIPSSGAIISFVDILTLPRMLFLIFGFLLCISSIIIYFAKGIPNIQSKLNSEIVKKIEKNPTEQNILALGKISAGNGILISKRTEIECVITRKELKEILNRILRNVNNSLGDTGISRKQRALLIIIYKYAPDEEYNINELYNLYIEFLKTSNKETDEKRGQHVIYKSQFLVTDFKEFYFRLKDLAYHFEIPLIVLRKVGLKTTRLKKLNFVFQGLYETEFLKDSLLEND
jgi:hypothetical protein